MTGKVVSRHEVVWDRWEAGNGLLQDTKLSVSDSKASDNTSSGIVSSGSMILVSGSAGGVVTCRVGAVACA